MLPPGHIAGGYITAKFVLSSLNYNLPVDDLRLLSLIGMFFSFAPDLDFFAAFVKTKSFKIENDKVSHRKFFTHAPLVWFVAAMLIFFIATDPFFKALVLMVWVGSWTHFILDSEWGVMWLWPFSKKFYPFSESYYQRKYLEESTIKEGGFWRYWLSVAKREYRKIGGFLEIILIILALALALN